MSTEPHIIIELVGGAADGTYLDSHSNDERERYVATDFYGTTDGGLVGRDVECSHPPLESMDFNFVAGFTTGYRVIDRIEENGEVLLQMRILLR